MNKIYTFGCIGIIAILYTNATTAQSVSFGRSGIHMPRKLVKQQKNEQQSFEEQLEKIRSRIGDAKFVEATNANLGIMKYNSRLKVYDTASAENVIHELRINYSPTVLTRKALRQKIRTLRDSVGERVGILRSKTEDTLLAVYRNNLKKPDEVTTQGNVLLDMAEDRVQRHENSFRAIKILLRKNYNSRDFFPATYASESINFFTSKDTLASKFFNDNSLVFNSGEQKLGYSSEAYADYFGPIRLGLGYTITSASNDVDTNEAMHDAIQKVVTNGGNLNYNVSYPLLCLGNGSTLSFKAYLSTKGGVDIPKDSAAASTYGFLTTSGIVTNLYTKGYMDVIQLFFTSRMSYIYGNKNFENHLNQNNFWLWQNSLGIAVKDKFRIRLDVYNGLSGSANSQFVKSNFPVTVSFDIVNPF